MTEPPLDIEAIHSTGSTRYIIFGWETCPESGKLHQQGYVELAAAMRLGQMKTLFSPITHFESANGCQVANIRYCKKEGDWHEVGTPAAQGKAKEADVLLDRVRGGARMADLFPDMSGHAYFQYGPGLIRGIDHVRPHRTDWSELRFNFGVAGAGKSKDALDAGAEFLEIGYASEFISGYVDYPEVVCFDEFAPSKCYRQLFLRLTDRMPFRINCKYGDKKFSPKVIYFTTIENPREWYFKDGGNWDDQCERRLNSSGGRIKEFTL